jgi:uncharacterized membrane protein (DUF2068 family)
MGDEPKNLSPEEMPKRAPTLYLIVGIKALKGVAALLLALGAYSLTDNDLPSDFRQLLTFFHLDPEKKFFLDLADRISEITPANLNWLAVISIIYGSFMLLQAVGLALRVKWIVWLVIGESAFFIPIEVFELIHRRLPNLDRPHLLPHPKIAVALVLAVNVAIVWYLYKNRNRLIRHHHHP